MSRIRVANCWIIVGKRGRYRARLHSTRMEAIDCHIGSIPHLRADGCDFKDAWDHCRERGDRAVKATITWKEAAK